MPQGEEKPLAHQIKNVSSQGRVKPRVYQINNGSPRDGHTKYKKTLPRGGAKYRAHQIKNTWPRTPRKPNQKNDHGMGKDPGTPS